MKKASKRPLAYLCLLTTNLIWGVATVVIKYTFNFIDPLSFLFVRFLISSLAMAPLFLLFVRRHPLRLKDIPPLFLLGTLSTTIVLGLFFLGVQATTAIDVALVSAVGPILVVFAGAKFLEEKITQRERLGLMIAVAGTTIALFEPLFQRDGHSQGVWGNLLVFSSWIAWAVYVVSYKKKALNHHPLIITFFNFFSGLMTITPIFLLQSRGFDLQINPAAWPGILYVSLLSSCVAFFTYNLGVSLIEASEATLFNYLRPIFTAPLAIFWLKEEVTLFFLIGGLVIVSGVVISESR